MGRQHLSVGVDVDALPLGLLQQCLEVLQVVAGDEDGLPLLCAEGNLGRHGMAVRPGIARIEKLHGPDVRLARLHGEADPVIQAEIGPVDGGEGLFHELVDLVVRLAEDLGVVGIGGHAFDAEEHDVLEGTDVLVLHRTARMLGDLFTLGHHCRRSCLPV